MIGRVDEITSAVGRLGALSNGTRSFEDVLAAALPGGPVLDLASDPTALAIKAGLASGPNGSDPAPGAIDDGQRAVAGPSTSVTMTPTFDAPAALGEPDWASALPQAGQRWAGAIDAAASSAGIDPRLLAALVWSESAFDPGAVSPAGAIGLGQLMPGTASGLGVNPWEPTENLDGAARYLAEQIDRFGRTDHALAAYNAGPGRVLDAGGVPNIAETQAYVRIVLDRFTHLGGAE